MTEPAADSPAMTRTNSGHALLSGGASTRTPELDILRGIAVILVLFRHPVLPPEQSGALAPLLIPFHHFSGAGVDLFFVLSGFLIGGLLFNEFRRFQSVDIKRFLLRRGFKIYPAYVVFILYAIVFRIRHEHCSIRRGLIDFWPNYIHIQNYYNSPQGHTWTLALEEHFYLGFALLVGWLVSRRRIHWIPLIALTSMVVCTALRFANLSRPFEPITHFSPTHLRADSLFTGVVLSYFYHLQPHVLAPLFRRRLVVAVVGLAILAPMCLYPSAHPFVWTIGFSLLYVGFACLLLAFVPSPQGERGSRRLASHPVARGLAFVGFYSYSIYLWHTTLALAPVEFRLRGALTTLRPETHWIVEMSLYIAVAIGAGVVMALIVERPFLALRDRLIGRRSEAVEAIGMLPAASGEGRSGVFLPSTADPAA